MEVDLPRLTIEGRSDARINAIRAQDGALEVNVRGALFDAAQIGITGAPVPGLF